MDHMISNHLFSFHCKSDKFNCKGRMIRYLNCHILRTRKDKLNCLDLLMPYRLDINYNLDRNNRHNCSDNQYSLKHIFNLVRVYHCNLKCKHINLSLITFIMIYHKSSMLLLCFNKLNMIHHINCTFLTDQSNHQSNHIAIMSCLQYLNIYIGWNHNSYNGKFINLRTKYYRNLNNYSRIHLYSTSY